jgi:hypothetical protein
MYVINEPVLLTKCFLSPKEKCKRQAETKRMRCMNRRREIETKIARFLGLHRINNAINGNKREEPNKWQHKKEKARKGFYTKTGW